MPHLTIRDVARRLFTTPETIRRLIKDGVIPQPIPVVERGWDCGELPVITKAVQAHIEAGRAARAAGFEKARTIRTANLDAKRAAKAAAAQPPAPAA